MLIFASMDIQEIREYCLSLPLAEETMPFGPEHLVYKICGRMFALAELGGDTWINLKCDPERALELRDRYEDISPGWHMNKKHWNTVNYAGDLPGSFVKRLIDDSYLLAAGSLSKAESRKVREEYEKFRER